MAVWTSIQLSEVRSGFRIDSEFYKEEYLQKDYELFILKRSSLGRIAKVTDGEHGSVKFIIHGIKYLTAENVKQGYIDYDGVRYVGPEVDRRNARARVCVDDVLISIKGTLGEVGVAEKELLPANMNRDVAIIKPFASAPSGLFISAFLRSTYGKYQLAREGSGGVQQMITLERLRNIQIPQLSDGDINLVVSEYKQALSKRQESIKLYTQAQHLLETELGLDKLHFDKPVGYTARFSITGLADTFDAGRMDAQCFSPEAIYYEAWLLKHSTCDRLNICLTSKAKGRQQAEVTSGSIAYCSIKHISGREIVGASKTEAAADAPVANKNDLLLAITGATIGKIGIVNRYDSLLFSGDMLRLRVNNCISPHYLLLTLDHYLGQVQFNRWITGSTNGHLAPHDVGRVLVPRLASEKEEQISGLVAESLRNREESEQLLDQAKSRVEQLIEEAVQK